MEDASKALIMAGSILIGVMLLTLFVVTINKISIWPEAQDEIKQSEQIAKFNAEYEVYQKSAMYGVDVISCLNKAKSNNEKYVEGGSFLGEAGYGKNYEVNVTIELKTHLTESISVTAISHDTISYKERTIYDSVMGIRNAYDTPLKMSDVFNINTDEQLTSFRENDFIKYTIEKSNSGIDINEKYELIDSSVSDENNPLLKLLGHSNEPKQIVKNTESNLDYNRRGNVYGWCTATWTTYLYSFKQKRFQCTNLEYSDKTGYVSKLEFKEI